MIWHLSVAQLFLPLIGGIGHCTLYCVVDMVEEQTFQDYQKTAETEMKTAEMICWINVTLINLELKSLMALISRNW